MSYNFFPRRLPYRRSSFSYPRRYGTRYFSTRRTPGLYRPSSRYVLTGRARRLFGRRAVMNVMKSVAEHKYRDTLLDYLNTTGSIPSDGVMNSLCEIPNGQNDQQRIGDKLTMTSLQFAITIFSPQQATLTDNSWLVRVIIFIWKDDTAPTRDDIVTQQGLPAAAQPNLWFLNHDKKIKRKLLLDKTFTCFNQSVLSGLITYSSTVQNPYLNYKCYIPLSKYRSLATINFNNSTTVGVNKIYCLAMSNIPIAAIAQGWNVLMTSRVNFIDM